METVELQSRTRMGEKGRVVIPAAIREAAGITVGDALDIRAVNGEVHISTIRSRIRRAQEIVRQYIPAGVLLSEELSAERREAAKHE